MVSALSCFKCLSSCCISNMPFADAILVSRFIVNCVSLKCFGCLKRDSATNVR